MCLISLIVNSVKPAYYIWIFLEYDTDFKIAYVSSVGLSAMYVLCSEK